MTPIKSACERDFYPALKQSGFRPIKVIRWIVLHSTEGGTAESVARFFQSPAAGGSTHLVVDDDSCQRCLSDATVPQGAPGANTQGFHIEQCAFAKWTTNQWMAHQQMLKRAAYKTAVHCFKFSIPAVFQTSAGLKAGRRGITTHVEVTRAFGGGTHWDPGPGWPRDWFMQTVKLYLSELHET